MRNSFVEQKKQYTIVAQAIEYIRTNARKQPSLADIAAAVNLSEYHLQRIFTEWAGISPKRFLQYLTKEHAKYVLQESMDVLSATLEAGLSSPGRLHELMISCEAMSPGEIKARGHGVNVKYGISNTPFGAALIGWTPRGICNLAFCEDDGKYEKKELLSQWSAASLLRDDEEAAKLSERIFPSEPKQGKLHLVLRGTNFQIKVWEALLSIGSSQLVSYSTLSRMAGSPNSQRAVGTALAANKIGFLIPCHRVIRESGDVGTYRWGSDRKVAIHAWEVAMDNERE